MRPNSSRSGPSAGRAIGARFFALAHIVVAATVRCALTRSSRNGLGVFGSTPAVAPPPASAGSSDTIPGYPGWRVPVGPSPS